MGVLPGVAITLLRTAPLGDPMEIRVRGYNLTLRKSEAEFVLVERIDGA
jgi:ferrous iron transport protein A